MQRDASVTAASCFRRRAAASCCRRSAVSCCRLHGFCRRGALRTVWRSWASRELCGVRKIGRRAAARARGGCRLVPAVPQPQHGPGGGRRRRRRCPPPLRGARSRAAGLPPPQQPKTGQNRQSGRFRGFESGLENRQSRRSGGPCRPGGRLGRFPTASGGQLGSAPHRRPSFAGLEWMAQRRTEKGGAGYYLRIFTASHKDLIAAVNTETRCAVIARGGRGAD